MKEILSIILMLLLTAGSSMSERKPLDKKHREIKPGASEVLVPNPKRKDGYDLVIKNHEVKYDEQTGLYTYRYWQTDSTYVDLLYEPSNRLDVTVACTVVYNGETDEYTYTYHLSNSKNSIQPLRTFAVDIDRNLILRTESEPWYYYSTSEPPPGSPKWAFWGSMGKDVLPGGSVSLRLVSKYGPVIAICYSKGRARTFDHPVVLDELGVPPSNKEGLKGQTLAPGILEGGNAQTQFEAFLKVAETWGWISQAKRGQVLGHLTGGFTQNTFSSIKDELEPVPGEVESEVPAFLTHIGKLHRLLPEQGLDTGEPGGGRTVPR